MLNTQKNFISWVNWCWIQWYHSYFPTYNAQKILKTLHFLGSECPFAAVGPLSCKQVDAQVQEKYYLSELSLPTIILSVIRRQIRQLTLAYSYLKRVFLSNGRRKAFQKVRFWNDFFSQTRKTWKISKIISAFSNNVVNVLNCSHFSKSCSFVDWIRSS